MKQIIALGGGGFSMEPENPLLDSYILSQSKEDNPNICFIPTASGDADNYIARFYDFFKTQNCKPTHLSLFNPPTRDLEDFILKQDIIYVGGGNTKNLLVLWREWGLDKILKKAWEKGIVLAGISAGAICWFEESITDSYGDGLEPIQCLGFLNGSHCPHYDGEKDRRPSYHHLIKSQLIKAGIAADDGVAIHYIDDEIAKIVSSRPKAKAYQVILENKVVEKQLPTEFLGKL
ncbi:Type 1 glutamine amidotransferase-like domain-containing protein [Viridibacillus sp. FSL R5-0888]|uniref:Type 1 glutamine amidotransferase-like domain-containing protein n=1 Tax=Viridibacillus sp. FSL R5-0888 TaxID=2921663 RepID=UPI0030F80133